MQLRALIWKYEGNDRCLWRGESDGLLRHVSFSITQSASPDEYTVSTDLNGIDSVICVGLDAAKKTAQELLNSYAFSLIIF